MTWASDIDGELADCVAHMHLFEGFIGSGGHEWSLSRQHLQELTFKALSVNTKRTSKMIQPKAHRSVATEDGSSFSTSGDKYATLPPNEHDTASSASSSCIKYPSSLYKRQRILSSDLCCPEINDFDMSLITIHTLFQSFPNISCKQTSAASFLASNRDGQRAITTFSL